jgi:hypothetical protein
MCKDNGLEDETSRLQFFVSFDAAVRFVESPEMEGHAGIAWHTMYS